MGVTLANNAVSTLAASITDDATTISIRGADAGKFPVLAADEWSPATIIDAANNMEIVKIVARAAAVLTVERAQEGTTAKAFPAGARIDVRMTAGAFAALADRDGLKEVAYTGSYNDLIDKPPGTTTTTVGAAIAGANGKTTPDDGDFFAGVAAGASTMFKTTWANIKAALDVLYYRKSAVDTALGGKVSKTGDTLTGDTLINKNYPTYRMLYPGVRDIGVQVREDGRFAIWDFSAVGHRFSVGIDGSVWTAQLGDLNTRIEQRASDFANDRVANLNSRWVSRGQVNTGSNNWFEAPAGAALTGGYNSAQYHTDYFYYRYFQLFDPVRGWITAHNA